MKVLLDNCLDERFRRYLFGFEVVHAMDVGWRELSNGNLIAAAEDAGFDALVTVDRGIRHQQSLKGRKLSVVTLLAKTNRLRDLTPLVPKLVEVLSAAGAGGFFEVSDTE